MTIEQEKIAEEMVKRMKLENGSTDWIKYRDMKSIKKLDIILIVQALKELKVIEDIVSGSTSIRLTEIGWRWPGFSEQRRIADHEKQTHDQINELTLKKLKLEQFPAKFWWLLILIAAIMSILTNWISNKLEDTQKEKPAIYKTHDTTKLSE